METEILIAASMLRPFCHIESRIVFNKQFIPRKFRESPWMPGDAIIAHEYDDHNEYWRDVDQLRAYGLYRTSGGKICKR